MSIIETLYASSGINSYLDKIVQNRRTHQAQSSTSPKQDRVSFSENLFAKLAEHNSAPTKSANSSNNGVGQALSPATQGNDEATRNAKFAAKQAAIQRQLAYNYAKGTSAEVTMQLFAEQSATHIASQQTDPASAADRYAAAQRVPSLDEVLVSQKNNADNYATISDKDTANINNYNSVMSGNVFTSGKVSTTSTQGTIVTVSTPSASAYELQITRKDGLQLTFEARDDMRINDLEDGSLSVYFPASGQTCLFDASGAMSVLQGETGQSGTGSDDIIINVKGTKVDGGDGNDTVFNFADNAAITTGEGDDAVFTTAQNSLTIDTGNGNDRLFGKTLYASTVNMGEGDNSFHAGMAGGELRMGDGNNTLISNNFIGSSSSNTENPTQSLYVSVGNGNNYIHTGAISKSAEVSIGDGNNNIQLGEIEGEVSIGNGCNNIQLGGIKGEASIGNGHNTIQTGGVNNGVSIGNGNNEIRTNLGQEAKLNVGNGKNTVTIGSMGSGSTATLGNGGNTVIIERGMTNASISTGSGEDTFFLESGNRSVVDAGAGNDTIYMNNLRNSTLYAGDGDDTIYVDEAQHAFISGGNGNDSIHINNAFGMRVEDHDNSTKIRNGMYATENATTMNTSLMQWKMMQGLQRYAQQS